MGERRRTRREFLRGSGLGAAAMALPGSTWARPAGKGRPDVVLIMADDMGHSDIGCYGGEIRTPNVDRLAAGGLRFTQFYNTARCCPTRATLMTGLYAHQAGVGHMVNDRGADGYRGDLNDRCVTIAEVLRGAGYGTYMSGKWHVTRFTGAKGPKHNWPRQRGFDRYFGTITGAGSFWTPHTLTRENEPVEAPKKGFYYTDAVSDHAAKFIAGHHAARPAEPLFLYVAFTAPHWPLHAPKEDVDRYRGKYAIGWDAVRAARHKRMIEMGLVKASWPITPRDPAAAAWDKVPEERKRDMALRMAVYAAQVDRMDEGIGRIVEALRKAGRLDNTLVLFLSDNGGCAEGGPWGFERRKGGVLGEDSSFASYGLSWANASNTPFRRYKHWVHEGGIATPLVVHWPKGFAARGELRHQPGHLIDIMATCVAVSGATYPKQHKGKAIQPMEGRSLLPAFDDKPIEREAIFWEHEGNRAVRIGKWKLVARGRTGPWELYDLDADRTELKDLAGKHPKRVEEMAAAWQKWAERANVLPWPGSGRRNDNVGSKAKDFDLKQGDALPRGKCPRVANTSVTVTATIRDTGPGGVILAQGGSGLGYALYVEGGRLAMATRTRGKLTVVTAPQKLPAGEVAVSGRLDKTGRITLTVAGKQVAAGKAPGPIPSMPVDGLQVGRDLRGAVGRYAVPNKFAGKIIKAHVQLGK